MPTRKLPESRGSLHAARPSPSTRAAHVETPIVEVFFVLGAVLIVVGLIYSIARSWPSFDPLALSTLVGIGLLLVVVCERLRTAIRELRTLNQLMRTAIADSRQEP